MALGAPFRGDVTMSRARQTPSPAGWAVIGGGMMGMTLANRLARAGRAVTLYEAADHVGGLAAPWSIGDVVWDRHYHVILPSDQALLALLDEIGLASDLRWARTRTGVYVDGRVHSVSNSLEMLMFPALGLVDKVRLAATILLASRLKDVRPLERETVEAWLRRWSGDRTYERFWRPLLRSKLGDNHRIASAAFIWATIQRLYAARRTGMKREVFGYVSGGYARVLSRFEEVLRADGVRIETGRPVEPLRVVASGVEVLRAGRPPARYQYAVLTTPCPVAARLCPDLAPAERDRLLAVRYMGIACASLLLKRPLAGFYVTNLLDEGLPFTGVIEMSALTGTDPFGGRTLVYLPRYLSPEDPFLSAPDDEVRDSFLAGIARMFPDVRPGDVEAFRLSRVPYVMALPTLRYSERVPPVRTSLPGVFLVNSAQIVAGTLNVNETVALAERASRELLALEGTP